MKTKKQEAMRTDMAFQTLKKGAKRPDCYTVSDATIPVGPATVIPNVGEFVTLPLIAPEGDRGKLRKFKVVGKNHAYGYVDGAPAGCTIFVIVSPVDGNEPGVDFRE